jgi:hypothetical protein
MSLNAHNSKGALPKDLMGRFWDAGSELDFEGVDLEV